MILYYGHGTAESIQVVLFGDGTTTRCEIDLTSAPFNLEFGKIYPAAYILSTFSGSVEPQVTLFKNLITLTFDPPLPAFDVALKGPRTELNIRFLYGITPP